jgi:hypothetical protein
VDLSQGAVIEMKKDPETSFWTTVIPLAPAVHYKYVLDAGVLWQEDPNTEWVDDGYGARTRLLW